MCDCGKQCGEIATDRLRYFTGRFMTARDFHDEQKYWLSRHRLHTRVMHGWGVVCGLYVYPHPKPDCSNDHISLKAGIAVDCCGREIVVPSSAPSPAIPFDKKPQENPDTPRPDRYHLLLCLHYVEKDIECVPVLYSECNCDPQRREFSRIRESYELEWHWVRERDLADYGWHSIGGVLHEPDPQHPCPEDDCDKPGDDTPGPCIEARCPKGHCVPLALIRIHRDRPITKEDIETGGRPVLKPPREALTHIVHTNWKHGGVMSVSELRELKKLKIYFDRRLKRRPHQRPGICGPTGVNPCTFLVDFYHKVEEAFPVPYTEPPHVEHECVAAYSIDPEHRRLGRNRSYDYLENSIVSVTLKCDFILDCHDNPVDGDHLGGRLPSGDGIRGGTFESWFEVLPDRECEQRRREELEHQEHGVQEQRA